MSSQTDVHPATESHGKGVSACEAGGDTADHGKVHTRHQAGMRFTEQCMREDGASAKISGHCWAKQIVVKVLRGTGGDAQYGKRKWCQAGATQVGCNP